MNKTFNTIHLFNVLQRSWETRADVTAIKITLVDMVRFKDEVFANIEVETESETYCEEEWRKLLEDYYPLTKIKKRVPQQQN